MKPSKSGVHARNTAFREAMSQKQQSSDSQKEASRARYTSRLVRRRLLEIPEIIDAIVPEVPGAPITTIKMLCTKPGSELRIEFNVQVFEYMYIAGRASEVPQSRRCERRQDQVGLVLSAARSDEGPRGPLSEDASIANSNL